jgi:hypothetical protein
VERKVESYVSGIEWKSKQMLTILQYFGKDLKSDITSRHSQMSDLHWEMISG